MSSLDYLRLIESTDPLLNQPSEKVKSEELHNPEIQGVIDRMLKISAGKGKSKFLAKSHVPFSCGWKKQEQDY